MGVDEKSCGIFLKTAFDATFDRPSSGRREYYLLFLGTFYRLGHSGPAMGASDTCCKNAIMNGDPEGLDTVGYWTEMKLAILQDYASA